jgi:FemAB-related protein (PEP-CTERM system-associated)
MLSEAGRLQQELGASHAELRHTTPWPGDLPTKQHKVSMLLELAHDADSQWKRFDPKLRNQIRKAEKSGLTAVVGGSELLDDFYTVFVRNMRDLGTPVYAREFFEAVMAGFPGETRFITIYHNGKPVAAGLIIWFRDTVEIPWASSIRDFNALCPNNLLYWTALQFSVKKGFKKFDFGRSTPGEGTYRFKEQWGAEPLKLHWQYLLAGGVALPELNTKNPRYEMAIKMWQKLPLPVTRILGPHIVRCIP